MEHESNGDTNSNWCALYNSQSFDKGIGRLTKQKTNGDNLDYSEYELSSRYYI